MKQPQLNDLERRLSDLFGRFNYERKMPPTSKSFKLQGMRELLEELGNPHLSYPVVHVAGTKGKGSVSTMVGAILTESGHKTGVYTSPHLESIHQRLKIDGQMISDEGLIQVLDNIQPALDRVDAVRTANDKRPLTFFEVCTGVAFLYFAQQKVDAVVLEVGLGGRLDSTNVCQPAVCVITNISHDHTKQLGETLQEIANEKAGIIKAGVPVISGAVNPAAHSVIQKIAIDRGSELFVLDRDFDCQTENENEFSTRGTIGEVEYELTQLKPRMLGAHQLANASIAVAATKVLQAKGFTIPDRAIHHGLETAHLAGRTEVVSREPTIVLDMAHNVASTIALVETMRNQFPNWSSAGARRLLMATSRDKDALGMLQQLIQHFDEIVFCKYETNPRGKEPSELLQLASRLRDQMNLAVKLQVIESPQEAWAMTEEKNRPDDIVCIAGSAFLIAELRPKLIGK